MILPTSKYFESKQGSEYPYRAVKKQCKGIQFQEMLRQRIPIRIPKILTKALSNFDQSQLYGKGDTGCFSPYLDSYSESPVVKENEDPFHEW